MSEKIELGDVVVEPALIYVHNVASQDADMHVLFDLIKKSHAVVVHCSLHILLLHLN